MRDMQGLIALSLAGNRGRLLRVLFPSILFACIGFLLGSVRGITTFMIGPVLIHAQPALFVIAGVIGGPVAVLGSLVGYTVSILDLLPTVPVMLLGYCYLGFSAYALQGHLWQQTITADGKIRKRLNGLIGVAIVSTLGAATLTGWGYEVLGQFHFFPYALLTFLSLTASIILYGGPVIALLSLQEPDWVRSDSDDDIERHSSSRWETVTGQPAHLSVLPLAWLVIGSILSAGLQVGELLPARMLRRTGWEFLHHVREVALQGVGGSKIQIGLGTTMVVLWVSTIRRRGMDI